MGPWAFRSAVVITYNAGVHTVNLLFVEPELRSCAAIRKVAEVNDFRPPKFNVSIACEHASAEVCRKWAVNLEVVDVFDVDCQGCELFRKSLIFSTERSKSYCWLSRVSH